MITSLDGISNPCALIKLLLDKYLLLNQKLLFNVASNHHQAILGENILLGVVLEPLAIRPAQPHLHNPYSHQHQTASPSFSTYAKSNLAPSPTISTSRGSN
jgi:hypothetical protein